MGITIKSPNKYGYINDKELKKFEKSHELSLPKSYRNFLKKNNGGQPFPNTFWINKGSDASGIQEFFGLHSGPEWLSLSQFRDSRLGIPKNLLPIADDGTGNLVCLKISGIDKDSIYFIDHETHPYTKKPNSRTGIKKIANSFDELLEKLGETNM